MASLYRKTGSPFWWISSKRNGKWVDESTKCRVGFPTETRRARALALQRSAEENQTGAVRDDERWSTWVPRFLSMRYADSPKTLERYTFAWRALSVFLDSRKIPCPSAVRYAHLQEYMAWRQNPDDPAVFRRSHNNALGELKVLRLLLAEAVRRDFIIANPAAGMGIKKQKPKEKPEMTDEEIEKIRAGLKTQPDWMRVAFEIALHQGCRLGETSIPFKDVDLERMTITFNAKGSNRFTTALNPDLVPLMVRLKAEQRTRTCDLPPMPSKAWWLFFRSESVDLPHLCFHCLRVTAITHLARKGVSQSQAMRFVGHASETIHRVYQRLQPGDVGAACAALHFPRKTDGNPAAGS